MPSKAPGRHDPLRQPLDDVTSRVHNQATTPPRQQATRKTPSSPLIIHHHQSVRVVGHLQATGDEPENKRISAITNESQRDSKRDSQASSTSTNASGSGRPRKTHIGPWQLGSTLGTGATGRVRKARHAMTNQLAAVKVVSKRNAIDLRSSSVMQMDKRLAAKPLPSDHRAIPFGIEREVVIMKLIEHPNIIKLYDLWENRGELYLVLELVEGGELFTYILKRGTLEEMEAVRIFRQIISAVGYCHEFKVCHRDIKPENILLDSMGNVKLVDFGMASREHSEGLATSCGSPHYAPPEIALGQKYRGAQADIWSCGVVLYVMLCGQLPFGMSYTVPEEVQLVLQEVVRGEIEFPQRPEIGDSAVDLILRMLEHYPHERISIRDIWAHPLLVYYEPYAQEPEYASTWIGGAPPQLTSADCGEPIKRREDIDFDILRGVCTLWHSNHQDRMIASLMSPTPNYEKIIYKNLLKFKIEQEENYQGVAIEFSGSDYHHASRRPMRRSATRSSLLGAGQKRTSSQFSIAEPSGARRPSTKSRGAASEADTELSYDPFRPSRHQLVPAEADHAKITLLNGSSNNSEHVKHTSKVPSLRHPAVARLQQEHSSGMGSSPPPIARDGHGRIRELRRQTIPRQTTSSSWASTRSSREGSLVFHKSASYRRNVVFQHKRKNSSIQRTPPPRPRNPTPLTLQQRYVQDSQSSDPDPFTSPPRSLREDSASMSPPPIRSRKESQAETATDAARKRKNRSSAVWEERTRQFSAELSNLCDEVFKGNSPDPHFFDKDLESEKLRTFARRSVDLPSFQSCTIDADMARDRPRPRPLPVPPVPESQAMKTYLELAQTKERLERHAKELGSNELNNIIQQIDRLMAANLERMAEQEHRRIVSAPDPRGGNFQELSPVKEEDEFSRWGADSGPRHVSEPAKGSRGYQRSIDNVNAWNYPFSIRPVDDAELRPRPLTIKKKASEPVLGSSKSPQQSKTDDHGLRGRLKAGNASTSALDRLFGTSTRSVHSRSRTGESSLGSALEPIGEHDDKENHDPKGVKRASDENKGIRWFRRSGGSQRSSNSDTGHETAGKERYSATAHHSDKHKHVGSGTTSNNTSDDITFRPPQKEKVSTTTKLLRFFGKKDKRMHIAMTGEENDSAYGEASTSDSFSSAYAHGALSGSSTLDSKAIDSSRRAHFGELPAPSHKENHKNSNGATHNWFARFLHVKPARRVIPLTISRDRAIKEIHSILRDWRRYGLREVSLDKKTGRIMAVVNEKNSLGVKPVTLMCEVFPVAMRGRAQGMAVARFNQEKGAKTSFDRAVSAMQDVLKGRGLLVTKKSWAKEMRKCLADWESG